MYFNPRTPCGVRRGYGRETVRHAIFQSTHPVRGATAEAAASGATARAFQSTHPVRGATASRASAATLLVISIHAPRAGCDHEGGVTYADETKFQSTHPVRGATRFDCVGNPKIGISIHAPRAGCDSADRPSIAAGWYFNPRTPCGVRRGTNGGKDGKAGFQSTHPVRGATN